jgi:calcineurin-like phosphoesterase family protein
LAIPTRYYTADAHFSHALMLAPTASSRPFASVRDMDKLLIRSWNSVVKPDEVVYHLGDFSMGLRNSDRVRSIFSRLLGPRSWSLEITTTTDRQDPSGRRLA